MTFVDYRGLTRNLILGGLGRRNLLLAASKLLDGSLDIADGGCVNDGRLLLAASKFLNGSLDITDGGCVNSVRGVAIEAGGGDWGAQDCKEGDKSESSHGFLLVCFTFF